MSLRAEISLAGPDAAPLGDERVRLLEAIGREGSISGAARAVGLSYRGAWNAVCAMNNLVGRPLVAGQVGGRSGGGAALTPEGIRLVESFRRLEREAARAFLELGADAFGADAARLMFGGFLRTSARNALRGRVVSVREGAVNAEAVLEIAEGARLAVSLTSRSLRDLGLFPGRDATALVKAPLVTLAPIDAPPPEARNRLEGRVMRVEEDPETVEIALDIGGGKTIHAVRAAAEQPLAPDDRAWIVIDPRHIILAVQ